MQPSPTGQLHRPKTQAPSPSAPTLRLTAYGALVDPATVPADVEVAVGVEVVGAREHVAAADVVPGPVERRRAVATAQVLVTEQRGQVDHDREPTRRRRQAGWPGVNDPVVGRPAFVLHEHHKPRHHFDLRLEEGGVLRSWALPKGVPTSPRQDRLAVAVGDHDLDHLDYEDADKTSRTSAGGRTRTAPSGGCSSCCTAARARSATR